MSTKNTAGQVIWKDRKHFMWFPWSFTRYSADKNRLYEDVGLLNTRHDEVLLYRVVDISMTRSLAQKIFGTGTITLHTKVDTSPDIHLRNIKNCAEVNRLFSDMIEEARKQRQVVGKEFFGSQSHVHDGDDDMDDSDFDL